LLSSVEEGRQDNSEETIMSNDVNNVHNIVCSSDISLEKIVDYRFVKWH